MKAIKFLSAMIFLSAIVVFGTANNVQVPLNIWMGEPLLGYQTVIPQGQSTPGEIVEPKKVPRTVSLWKIIFFCFTLGFLLAWAVMVGDVLRSRKLNKTLRKQLKQLEQADTTHQLPEPKESSEEPNTT